MPPTILRAVLAASLVLTAACGELPEGQEEQIELSSLDGLDLPADYAGGRYVKVKGAITKGSTKTGAFVGRDSAYGFTLSARVGETLGVRGTSASGMGLTALYGPQKSDGSWGPLRNKAWTMFPTERGVPTIGYKATTAGKYLVVLSLSSRRADAPDLRYAVTACASGQCTAGGCLEWSNDDQQAHWAFNYASLGEADVLLAATGRQNSSAHAGACGAQPTTCPTSRAPVCSTGSTGPAPITYGNVCKAKVALRAFVSTGPGASGWISTAPGACAN